MTVVQESPTEPWIGLLGAGGAPVPAPGRTVCCPMKPLGVAGAPCGALACRLL